MLSDGSCPATTTTTFNPCQFETFSTTGIRSSGDVGWTNPGNAVYTGDHSSYATISLARRDISDRRSFTNYGFITHSELPCGDETHDTCIDPIQTLSVSSIKVHWDAYCETTTVDKGWFRYVDLYFRDEYEEQCGSGGSPDWINNDTGTIAHLLEDDATWYSFEENGPGVNPPWDVGTDWYSDDLVHPDFGNTLAFEADNDDLDVRIDEIRIEICASCTSAG